MGVNFGDLEKLGVINICGVDKKGLPMIVVSACRFPLNTSEEHHQLFDFIQGMGYNSKTRQISNGRYIREFYSRLLSISSLKFGLVSDL